MTELLFISELFLQTDKTWSELLKRLLDKSQASQRKGHGNIITSKDLNQTSGHCKIDLTTQELHSIFSRITAEQSLFNVA